MIRGIFFGVLILCFPTLAHAVDGFDASQLTIYWGIPFVGVLLSLALCPLIAEEFWHHHYGKISAFWGLCLLIPFYLTFGGGTAIDTLSFVLLKEYIPFVLLLLALFATTGGIRLMGKWHGNPESNLMILMAGTILANFIGTTGASMLLIHPLIRGISWRKNRKHIIIFYIFLVANIGGVLTPLGDPPLFLGFLKGVPFFWTTINLFWSFLIVSGPLLIIFYGLDKWFYNREDLSKRPSDEAPTRFKIKGMKNVFLLLCIIGCVLMSGTWDSGVSYKVFSAQLALEEIFRDVGLAAIALLAVKLSRPENLKANHFTWEPILEIMRIFLAIFVTVVPVIIMLKAGIDGPFGSIVSLVNDGEQHHQGFYFWLTGVLSGFLDNAPTYLVFFNLAGGDAATLTTTHAKTLMSISEGAVFMGALTYIGNAPNFMVRSIAVQKGIKMPSFFGYMLWSVCILVPIFLLLTVLYIV